MSFPTPTTEALTMRLWIVSDLHLELTRGWDLPAGRARPAFDVMVVAGDLIPGMERGVRWLTQRVTDEKILYVAGNHEGFGRDIDRTVEKARQAAIGTNLSPGAEGMGPLLKHSKPPPPP